MGVGARLAGSASCSGSNKGLDRALAARTRLCLESSHPGW